MPTENFFLPGNPFLKKAEFLSSALASFFFFEHVGHRSSVLSLYVYRLNHYFCYYWWCWSSKFQFMYCVPCIVCLCSIKTSLPWLNSEAHCKYFVSALHAATAVAAAEDFAPKPHDVQFHWGQLYPLHEKLKLLCMLLDLHSLSQKEKKGGKPVLFFGGGGGGCSAELPLTFFKARPCSLVNRKVAL